MGWKSTTLTKDELFSRLPQSDEAYVMLDPGAAVQLWEEAVRQGRTWDRQPHILQVLRRFWSRARVFDFDAALMGALLETVPPEHVPMLPYPAVFVPLGWWLKDIWDQESPAVQKAIERLPPRVREAIERNPAAVESAMHVPSLVKGYLLLGEGCEWRTTLCLVSNPGTGTRDEVIELPVPPPVLINLMAVLETKQVEVVQAKHGPPKAAKPIKGLPTRRLQTFRVQVHLPARRYVQQFGALWGLGGKRQAHFVMGHWRHFRDQEHWTPETLRKGRVWMMPMVRGWSPPGTGVPEPKDYSVVGKTATPQT